PHWLPFGRTASHSSPQRPSSALCVPLQKRSDVAIYRFLSSNRGAGASLSWNPGSSRIAARELPGLILGLMLEDAGVGARGRDHRPGRRRADLRHRQQPGPGGGRLTLRLVVADLVRLSHTKRSTFLDQNPNCKEWTLRWRAAPENPGSPVRQGVPPPASRPFRGRCSPVTAFAVRGDRAVPRDYHQRPRI